MEQIDEVFINNTSKNSCLIRIGDNYYYFSTDDVVKYGKEVEFETYLSEHGVISVICVRNNEGTPNNV